jgi:hypothetical protein
MIALGWMNLFWMALFAAVIFGEKIWLRGGIWVARSAGISFMIVGVLAILGLIEIPTGIEIGKDNSVMDDSMHMTPMDMGNNNNINMKDNNNNMDINENTK